MSQRLISYISEHRSAILATMVIIQNSHTVKGIGASLIGILVALLGG